MFWWFKHRPKNYTYHIATGPFATEAEALDAQTHWLASPQYDAAHAHEVVQADKNYPNTLPHPVSKVMHAQQWCIRYSDGTLEPVS